jgi:dihydrolipoamide dehydrogenase
MRVLDSRAAASGDARSVLIVGGGCVGVEFAYLWSSYGARVTIVEHDAHLLGDMDEEVARHLEDRFRETGIEVLTAARVEGLTATADGVRARIATSNGARDVSAASALVAVGVSPNTADTGLEAAGVTLDARGFIAVDGRCETSAPGVLGSAM